MAVRISCQGRPDGRQTATREMTRQLDQVSGCESGRAPYRENTRPIESCSSRVDQEDMLERWSVGA